jgi:hypothetical protein
MLQLMHVALAKSTTASHKLACSLQPAEGVPIRCPIKGVAGAGGASPAIDASPAEADGKGQGKGKAKKPKPVAAPPPLPQALRARTAYSLPGLWEKSGRLHFSLLPVPE